VSFWSGLGGQSPVLGNVRGFQHFGDVEFVPCEQVQEHHLREGADLLFTPDIILIKNRAPEIFTILQMGGRGALEYWATGVFDNLYKVGNNADIVTMLDINLYNFLLTKNQPWEWSRFFLVPNGLHYDMFSPKKSEDRKDKDKIIVLMGKVGGVGKLGYDILKVGSRLKQAGYLDRIQLIGPVQLGYIPSRVWIPIESRPLYKMPQLYQSVDVFLNVPEYEVLPNTIFEAFLTGLPVVVSKGTSIGRIQTVPTKHLDKMRKDFGTSVDYFDDTWASYYEEGDHYLQGETVDEVTNHLITLYENPDLREKIGRKGREWALKLNWTWKDKCKLLLDLATKAGFRC